MADTIKTRAELITLFADNITNDISAQDLRDYLISVHLMTDLDQVVTVAKAGGQYTSIQSAIDSITDAASDKIYTVLVYPGEYDEAITLSNYVDIVAINPENTKILRQVSDDSVECHCYLKITIESAVERGLYTDHSNTVIVFDGDISSSSGYGVYCNGGTQTINGNVSSSASIGVYCSGGVLTIINGILTSTYNSSWGHGITLGGGIAILQNCKIICTHADAKSIYATSAEDAYCMGVWANRDDHANITQMITGGFNFDANVQ